MDRQLWHVVWTTFGERPPHDRRGDWTELSELYRPLVAAGLAATSRPLQARYLEQPSNALFLSQEDATQLREWLLQLTSDGGDRVAGGHPVSAAAFRPMQAHILFHCARDKLGQVVGRIKSRLAALLLFESRWSNKGRRIWAKGFWAAELLNDDVGRKVKTFIGNTDIYSLMVPESERPQYFHPEDLPRAQLEAEFNSGDADRIYAAFLNAAYFDESAWVQAKAIAALASPVAVVRWGALAALQILAAVQRELDPTVVVPAVMPLKDDPDKDVREVAKDALSDIKHIFGQ